MSDRSIPSQQGARYQPLRVLRQVLASPERYARPWYFAYLLLGIVTAGMVPVLLPLMMMALSHKASNVAYVMGAYDLGLLTSLLWGVAAERYKLYRSLFLAAFLLSIIAIAVFPLMRTLTGWMPAAFALGAGSSGAATIASLLIVDFEPHDEWEPRVGLLQSFNGAGQVLGLLMAGAFSHGPFAAGLWVAAFMLLPSLVFARLGLPPASRARRDDAEPKHPHRHFDIRALSVFPQVNLPSGIGFHFHALNLGGLRRLPAAACSPFGRFLLSWFMLAFAVAGFFTYFPLMLAHSYGLDTHLSSLIYALMAMVGITLFVLAGRWSACLGAGRVYLSGLWIRFVGFVLLALPLFAPVGHGFAFAAIGFALIVIAWPILSVSGTDLAARLAPFSEGAAMGLFNSAFSLATMIGAFAGGPLVATFGYHSIAIAGLVGIALAIVLGLRLMPQTTTHTAGK
jgi:predicted MFS family arabinose efflux permease